jgi:hypothetical protein
VTSRLDPYTDAADTARQALESCRGVFGGELPMSTFGVAWTVGIGPSAARPSRRPVGAPMAARYEYKVEEIREGMIGGKMSGDRLEKVLNDRARDGWQLKAITSTEVKGRIGPGGVEGVLVTFERPVA